MASAWADSLAHASACTCVVSTLLGPGCSPPAARESELEMGRRFVTESEFRRAALERSLAGRDDGDARLSCASCHSRTDASGRLLPGVASDFDLGALVGLVRELEAW